MSLPASDPFDTAGLQAAVLDAWRRSPTRYREDANIEEDYAFGAYRDRLVVELAQNAADAARTAGVPGRIVITVADDALVVANNGAPLDVGGVQSMAAMRASAKVGDGVGRFGVGFAAVLAVTDAPVVVSRQGSVRFSQGDTADLMRRDPALSGLLEVRPPPVLRVPFAVDRTDAGELDTAVILPWRDRAARDRAIAALRGIDDALFIALPDLVELRVDGGPDDLPRLWSVTRDDQVVTVSVDGTERRWWLHQADGRWSDADVAAVPSEARRRVSWGVQWAVPVAASNTHPDDRGVVLPWPDAPERVIHAPTPTDEPLAFPALLVGDFPVDASRRRLDPGPATDVMLDAAASAYAELVRRWADRHGAAAMALVPTPDLVGDIDGRLRLLVRERLGRTPWVRRASDGVLVTPGEVATIEPVDAGLVRTLAPHVGDLVAAEWLPFAPTLRSLGLMTRGWPDVWDVVAGLSLAGPTLRDIYAAADSLDAVHLEGLPVPLASGRTVRDVRRCVAPDLGGTSAATEIVAALRTLGVPVIDSTAMHPLLVRLGARPFDPRAHLGAEFVARVAASVPDAPETARELVAAAAEVLDAAGSREPLVGLGSVLVLTQQGSWRPAAEVALPDGALAAEAGPDEVLHQSLATSHRDGWLALGVLDGLVVVGLTDTVLDPVLWSGLTADGASWCEDTADLLQVPSPADLVATSVRVVRGLALLDGMEPEQVWALLRDPEVRAAVVEPSLVLDDEGRACRVPSPPAWWLGDLPVFAGEPAVRVRLPGDRRMAPFFPEVGASGDVDVELLRAIGVHTTVESWLQTPDGISDLLAALGDEATEIAADVVGQLYLAVSAAAAALDRVEVIEPPAMVRALVHGRWTVVDAESGDLLVASAPHHAHVLTVPFVPGGSVLAELLDLDASDDARCGAGGLAATGVLRTVPAEAVAITGISEYREHDQLSVGERDVAWWVTDSGEVHACTLDGLARALAWASGSWGRRWELAARLAGDDPEAERLEACYGV